MRITLPSGKEHDSSESRRLSPRGPGCVNAKPRLSQSNVYATERAFPLSGDLQRNYAQETWPLAFQANQKWPRMMS